MDSPNKPKPKSTPTPPSSKPSSTASSTLRPFSLRRTSSLSTQNTALQHQISSLQNQLSSQTTIIRTLEREKEHSEWLYAREVEKREAGEREIKELEELGRKFWVEEWAGMKDYLGVFRDVGGWRSLGGDVEERILGEYGRLFRGNEEDGNGRRGRGKERR